MPSAEYLPGLKKGRDLADFFQPMAVEDPGLFGLRGPSAGRAVKACRVKS